MKAWVNQKWILIWSIFRVQFHLFKHKQPIQIKLIWFQSHFNSFNSTRASNIDLSAASVQFIDSGHKNDSKEKSKGKLILVFKYFFFKGHLIGEPKFGVMNHWTLQLVLAFVICSLSFIITWFVFNKRLNCTCSSIVDIWFQSRNKIFKVSTKSDRLEWALFAFLLIKSSSRKEVEINTCILH